MGGQPFPRNRLYMRRLSSKFALISICVSAACVGCAGYQVGTGSLFRSDVRTVHVPIFKNNTFRRAFGERLTEAVVKEIESRTPYKVTSLANADSVLEGVVLSEQKRVVGEDANDQPLDLRVSLEVVVTWNNRLGQPLMQRISLTVLEGANLIPESGQTMVVVQQEVIERIARQIVGQMEASW